MKKSLVLGIVLRAAAAAAFKRVSSNDDTKMAAAAAAAGGNLLRNHLRRGGDVAAFCIVAVGEMAINMANMRVMPDMSDMSGMTDMFDVAVVTVKSDLTSDMASIAASFYLCPYFLVDLNSTNEATVKLLPVTWIESMKIYNTE